MLGFFLLFKLFCSYIFVENELLSISNLMLSLSSIQNMHGGYPEATLERFLRARDDNVLKASKMVSLLVHCLFFASWQVSYEAFFVY